jgi:non-specific serine/threonine protein kinase
VKATRGDFPSARALQAQALHRYRALGDRAQAAKLTGSMGHVARATGDYPTARALLEEALTLTRAVGNSWSMATILTDLALLAQHEGDTARASALAAETLGMLRTLGLKTHLAELQELLACAAAGQGRYLRAARLFAAAEAFRDATGFRLRPGDRGHVTRHLAATRAALGEAEFAAAWAAGFAMTLDDAVAYSLAEGSHAATHRAAGAPVDPLTPREREVALLLAQGLTDRQIAERLVVTEGTVGIHAGHIFAKLGLRSRAQVAAWAAERGLLRAGED